MPREKNKYVRPTPENDEDWPIGMMTNGELREVEKDGDAAEPTEENE